MENLKEWNKVNKKENSTSVQVVEKNEVTCVISLKHMFLEMEETNNVILSTILSNIKYLLLFFFTMYQFITRIIWITP